MKLTYTDTSKYKCDQCEYTAWCQSWLDEHITKIHECPNQCTDSIGIGDVGPYLNVRYGSFVTHESFVPFIWKHYHEEYSMKWYGWHGPGEYVWYQNINGGFLLVTTKDRFLTNMSTEIASRERAVEMIGGDVS